jgi:predicted transcriptional regulator
MKLSLSKLEILTLEQLCSGPKTAKSLSEILHAKPSFVSRVMTSLKEKNLVLIEKKEKQKVVSLSVTSHAQAFKRLYESRPDAKIEHWLSGMTIDILIILSENKEVPMNLLLEEAYGSSPTIYKYLKLLYGAGVVNRSQKDLIVADGVVRIFANEYARNIRLKLCEGISGIAAIVRIRKHVIIRTTSENVPPQFAQTGMTYLISKGLKANPTAYKDYCFELDGTDQILDVETAFVHAILLTLNQQQQDMPLLTVFLFENLGKMRVRWLRQLAKKYNVETKLDELLTSVTNYERIGRSL